jgi:hypothetical protein
MSVLEMFSSEGITYENLLSDLVRVYTQKEETATNIKTDKEKGKAY